MEIFDTEIKEIIHRQQVLETLKTNHYAAGLLTSPYAQKIIARCKGQSKTLRKFKQIFTYSFIVFILLVTLLVVLILIFVSILPTAFTTAGYSQYSITTVQAAINCSLCEYTMTYDGAIWPQIGILTLQFLFG